MRAKPNQTETTPRTFECGFIEPDTSEECGADGVIFHISLPRIEDCNVCPKHLPSMIVDLGRAHFVTVVQEV